MPLNDPRSDAQSSFDLGPESPPQGFWKEFSGGLVLVIGLAGIGVYQWLNEPPLQSMLQSPRISPTASPTASPKAKSSAQAQAGGLSNATAPNATAGMVKGKGERSPDVYQALPKSGTYYAENAALRDSRREITSHNGRVCIKLVNATSGENSVLPKITVSSLSLRNDGIYIDFTREKLGLDHRQDLIQDSTGSWQWLQGKVEDDEAMTECLASTAPYGRSTPAAP